MKREPRRESIDKHAADLAALMIGSHAQQKPTAAETDAPPPPTQVQPLQQNKI